jgi:Mrp family chromosome partitioning ATPase
MKEGKTLKKSHGKLSLYTKEIADQFWSKWQSSPFRFLLITSSVRGEGKTFVSFYLAEALALNFKTVLLISYIDGHPDTQLKTADQDETIFKQDAPLMIPKLPSSGISNLTLFSDESAQNNRWLLNHFEDLIQKVEKQFDIVLLDFPSLIGGNFPFAILPQVDKILLVVRANYAPKRLVLESLKLLGSYQDKLEGFVLNKRKEYIPKMFLSKFYK